MRGKEFKEFGENLLTLPRLMGYVHKTLLNFYIVSDECILGRLFLCKNFYKIISDLKNTCLMLVKS